MAITSEVGQPLRRYINDGNLWFPNGGPLRNEVLGRMQCAQARDPQLDLFLPTRWYAGSAAIRPEIVPWPWPADEIGVAFDQSSLWGVRVTANNPSLNNLIAVPRALPNGYTGAVPRGQWQSDRVNIPGGSYYSDDNKATWVTDASANLFVPTWSLRSPSGTIMSKSWGPMNFANKSGYAAAFIYNDPYYGTVDPSGTGTNYKITKIASSHIGFRGCKITINGYQTYGYTQAQVYIGWAPAGTTFTAPALPTTLASCGFSWASAVPSTFNPFFGTCTFNIGLTPPNAHGTLIDYWAWITTSEWSPTEHGTTIAMSPRTDVPFWFDVVGVNDGVSSDWHAPGGYLP